MQNQILTIRDSLLSGVTTFFNFLPTLIGALFVLFVGWVIAKGVSSLLERALRSAKLDQASMRTGLDRYLVGPYGTFHASHGIAVLAKWFILLIFVQAAANLMSMPQVTLIINSILFFIPNLAVALLMVVGGAYLGNFTSSIVFQAMSRANVARPDLFALLTRYTIVGFALIAALNHVGVAVIVVNTLLIGLVASVSLALGLAFGLGGQGVASEVTRTFYEQNKSGRFKSIPGGQSGMGNEMNSSRESMPQIHSEQTKKPA